MHKLSAAVAVFTVTLALSGAAWADTVQHRHQDFSATSHAAGPGDSRHDPKPDDDGSILF